MSDDKPTTTSLILPYLTWMVLMTVLPATAWAYAIRSAATAAVLTIVLVSDAPRVAFRGKNVLSLVSDAPRVAFRGKGVLSFVSDAPRVAFRGKGVLALAYGLAAGIAVFIIWISPEFIIGSSTPSSPSPYSPAVCGWALTLAKLAGSALVIPIAEELFFRKWLVDFAGFWWMVALFAVEHGERWHVGAITGIIYGVLARRFGLRAAIIAHSVTNLVLGLYVIFGEHWQYW